MQIHKWKPFSFVFSLTMILFINGCETIPTSGRVSNVEREVSAYEKAGITWGKELFNAGITPETDLSKAVSMYFMWRLIDKGDIFYYGVECDDVNGTKWCQPLIKEGYGAETDVLPQTSLDLISHLVKKEDLDFFSVHTDLKEAFKKGFRQGYQERNADLVLGPHLQKAAGIVGDMTAMGFISVINTFEKGWKEMLEKAVDVFIKLIADGSQAERVQFIKDFIKQYKKKYTSNQDIIKAGLATSILSAGGTQLYLDPNKTQSTLDMPSDESLKTEIYRQTFRVMGDEMGRRYSHNLISRAELVDWLRRSKTALNMDHGDEVDPKTVSKNLKIITDNFMKSYGADGKNVFEGLAKEAGY